MAGGLNINGAFKIGKKPTAKVWLDDERACTKSWGIGGACFTWGVRACRLDENRYRCKGGRCSVRFPAGVFRAGFLEEKFIEIPIVEKVVAGTPIFTQENIEGMVPVNKDDFKGVMFALKVIGHSIEPHIQEGDLLIIHKQENVDSGDVVIVMINGDMGTCKQIHKSKMGLF